MHIAFVCSEYPYKKNQPTGGFGRYVATISQGLVNAEHKVSIICQVKEKKSEVKHGKVKILPIVPLGTNLLKKINKYIQIPLVKRTTEFLIFPILWSFTVWLTLRRIRKEDNIDIIEGGDFGAELFFYLLFNGNVPCVIKLHTPSFVIRKYNDEPKNLFYWVIEFMENYCLKKATCLNSPSECLAKIVSKKTNRSVPAVIPYPVIVQKPKKKIRRNPNLVLYAGKLQLKKGVFTLLKAVPQVIKEIPEAKFVFVGPDTIWQGRSTKDKMRDFINRNNLEKYVTLSQEVNQKRLAEFYQIAAITVIPSTWENFPNVCLEAMNYGSSVIAARVGGLAEMVDNGRDGLLVNSNRSSQLVKAVVTLLRDRNFRLKLTKKAIKMIKNQYDIEKVTKKTLSFYTQCVNLVN